MIIRYTPAARADLADTYAYICDVLKNPDAARKVTGRIVENIAILKAHPLCGAELSGKVNRETDLRYLVCGKHIAFYRVQGPVISIIRILDGRTNYMQVLFTGEG